MLLGAPKIGKSALVSRFMDKNSYSSIYQETMIDNYMQLMFMQNSKGVRNREVTLNIRDVGSRFVTSD